MNEKLIDNVIRDYSLRELQIYSSKILSVCGATNSFIKQFKADNDSQQFYKNVIKWYVKKYREFPEKKHDLTFEFSLNSGGLGDKFVMISNILSTMEQLKADSIINFYKKMRWSESKGWGELKFKNFYEVIDFFHYKKSSYKIHTNVINEYKDCEDIIDFNLKNKSYAQNNTYIFSKLGKYWPINYDKTVKKEVITFMFYIKDQKHVGDKEKWITLEQEKIFNQLKKYLTTKKLNFVRLEDVDYAKNVELLSRSHLLIASEGMWTHLSRAMNIDTIAYTKSPAFIEEFTYQGHFCPGNFEECLTKLKEKCTNLMK
tara:strand:+ start:1471 stop:2415 length:945 start_codon:yes stop_codon:yes gene_type:complete